VNYATAALRRCARNWRQELADDPELGNLRLEIAAVGRVLVTEDDDSDAYQAARRRDWELRDQLRELEQRRAPW
jgi:hypothetical protein